MRSVEITTCTYALKGIVLDWRFRLRDIKTDCNGHLEVWVHKNDYLSLLRYVII